MNPAQEGDFPWRNLALLALLSVGVGFLLHQWTNIDRSPSHAEQAAVLGQPLAPFSLPDLDGQLRNIAEWRGQVLIINFWASWCAPCREEIPHFVELQNQYADRGLRFIGINMDEQPETARQYASQWRINYPVLTGGLLEMLQLSASLGNRSGGLPYTIMIDRTNRIVYTHRGLLSASRTERELLRYL